MRFHLYLLMFMVLMSSVYAATYTVCDSGCDYSSIQDAIDASSTSDIVSIGTGIYYESVIVDKEIEVAGDIDAIVLSTGGNPIFKITADDVYIHGLKLPYGEFGVYLDQVSGTTIENCIFEKNTYGIMIYQGSENIIAENDFNENNISSVSVVESEQNSISSNQFSSSPQGIMLDSSMNNTVELNNFSYVKMPLLLQSSHDNSIIENNLSFAGMGINVMHSSGNSIMGNMGINVSLLISMSDSPVNLLESNLGDELLARNMGSFGNTYVMDGINLTGGYFELSTLDIDEPVGFSLLSDVLKINFLSDIFNTGWVSVSTFMQSSGFSDINFSTVGLYTYDGDISPVFMSDYDGENISLDKQIIDAKNFYDINTEYAQDLDSNGLYDYLVFNIGVLIGEPGDYSVIGKLFDENDEFITECSTNVFLNMGIHSLDLICNGGHIKDHAVDGTYYLNSFDLLVNDSYYTEQLSPVYVTSYYTAESFEYYEVSVSLSLNEGWNIISIPLNTSINGLPSLFDTVSMFGYKNNSWFVPEEIDNKLGYWIKVNESVNVTIVGTKVLDKTIEMNSGWNLVGYPYLVEKNVSELYSDAIVYGYVDSEWYSYDSDREFNTLERFRPGYGYWVKPKI